MTSESVQTRRSYRQEPLDPIAYRDSFSGLSRSRVHCPSCRSVGLSTFYEQGGVPAHSVLLMPTPHAARTYPRGALTLAVCPSCGFISNTAFQPALLEYSARYEETQSFSSTFTAFHQRLARSPIERYDLRKKTIIEIGCGKGEFLSLLCELGDNRGVGFDPAYVRARNASGDRDHVHFVNDFYSEEHARVAGDFICCKMTLEHVSQPGELIATVRRSIGDRRDTVAFFQVPDVRRVLRETAFWDVYYEHCSYFSPGSLARLFRRNGFDVLDVWTDYDDQYLMVEAIPQTDSGRPALPIEETPPALAREVSGFAERCSVVTAVWKDRLTEEKRLGRRVVLWGGGSKAVAFLTTLDLGDEIDYIIDVNPHKQRTFSPGTGHSIMAPETARRRPPDVVIVMNPIYTAEIRQDLNRMGLTPELCSVTPRAEHAE